MRFGALLPAMIILMASFHLMTEISDGERDANGDVEPPRIQNINAFGPYTTGDPVTITADITDDNDVSSAWLVYGWSVSAPSSTFNISMARSGDIFSVIIFNPSNSTDSLWIMIKANDTSENWNSTGWVLSISIIDNDKPTFISDGSTLEAYTGDAFTFAANMDDNIGIFRASVNMTLDHKEYFNYSMCGAGNSRQTLVVLPLTARGNLSYRFWFSDSEGNNDTTPWFRREMFDNDAPILVEDLTEGPPTTGEMLWMQFWVYDNWEVTEGWLTFTMGGWDYNFSFLSGGQGNFTHGLYITPNLVGNLTYNATFIDGSGNRMTLKNRTMKIMDNDPPHRWEDGSEQIATTGDDIEFILEAHDNIRVESVDIHYLMPYEDWYISPMERVGESSKFRYTLRAPSDLESEIKYFFYMTDPSGNKNWTETKTVHVFDNDDPEILFEGTDEIAETGEDFTFRIALKDNIGIGSVVAVYSFNDDTFEVELEPSGPIGAGTLYEATIEVPRDAYGDLEYQIIVLDERGNRANISDHVGIVDTIVPEISGIGFWDISKKAYVTILTTGDPFKVEVDVTENIEAARVELSLTLPDQDTVMSLMKRDLKFGDTRTYTHEMSVPTSKIGRISYTIVVYDHDNETSVTKTGGMNIVDNDPPTVWNVSVPETISILESGEVRLQAVDNIGIVSVRIEMLTALGTYEEYMDMEFVGNDTYSAQLSPASDRLLDIEFRIVIDDGVNPMSQSYSVRVIDDVPPEILIKGLTEGSGYPDDDFINVTITVNEFSLWNVEGIVFVHEETGLEIEDYEIDGKEISFVFYPYKLGQWQFQFTVSDENEEYSILYLNFTIYDNTPPFMQIVEPEGSKKEGDFAVFSVENIQDSSDIEEVSWRVMGPDGKEIAEKGYSFRFKTWAPGLYHIWVTVRDDQGNFAVKDTWLEVEGEGEGGSGMSTPLIVLIVLIVIVGGLVLWLSIKDKIPEWFGEKE